MIPVPRITKWGGWLLQTYSQVIAEWVRATRFEDLPEDLVADVRLRILDVIGLSIAGGATPFGVAVRGVEGGAGRCRLWGTTATASLGSAAFANGALSQALEYDDTHNESIVHISSPAVSAALALVDDRGGTGRDLIRAVAIGNEISARAGSVAPGQFHKRGFHPPACSRRSASPRSPAPSSTWMPVRALRRPASSAASPRASSNAGSTAPSPNSCTPAGPRRAALPPPNSRSRA